MEQPKENIKPFENKKYAYLIIGLAIVVLLVVTVWQPGQWSFRDSTDYAARNDAAQKELEQYQALLASIQPNYAASQQLLKKIASEELVRAEVENALDVDQKIVIPEISTSQIKVTNRKDNDAMVNYLNSVTSMVKNYNQASAAGKDQLFVENANDIELSKAGQSTQQLVDNFLKMEVPKDAVEFHKAAVVAYQQYEQVFDTAKQYAAQQNTNPWPSVYNKYAVIDNRLAAGNTELNKISSTYALDSHTKEIAQGFIKTAQAQFAVTVVGDVQRAITEGIKAGLAKAFANFAIKMLDKLVGQIEKNFAIASQLYYSNDLGRYYSVEYMKKFVADPMDQDIIQKFLPEYFCISPDKSKLKEVFVAKARENVGSDLVINPSDPDFLQKLARLGTDEKNYPVWWEGYYETLAAKTKAEADAAATKEVISPGFKSGRDLISGQVNKTVASIFNVQEAAIAGTINLGTNNTENAIGALVAGVVESMVNKFIFTPITGGASGSGGISVIEEKDVCLQVPQVKPIIPVASTEYTDQNGQTTTAPYTTPPFNPRN